MNEQVNQIVDDAIRYQWIKNQDAKYLKWMFASFELDEIDKHIDECIKFSSQWDEQRMDVIGQNGNTGEHYEH